MVAEVRQTHQDTDTLDNTDVPNSNAGALCVSLCRFCVRVIVCKLHVRVAVCSLHIRVVICSLRVRMIVCSLQQDMSGALHTL